MITSEQKAVKTTYFSLIGNTALAIIKGVAGYFGNSYALIADAIESTSDIFSSLLVLLGLKYASKPDPMFGLRAFRTALVTARIY